MRALLLQNVSFWEKYLSEILLYLSVSFGVGKRVFLTKSFLDEIDLIIFESRQITLEILHLLLLQFCHP